MIADDLVSFVRSDLATFSLVVFAFIVIALGLISGACAGLPCRWPAVP